LDFIGGPGGRELKPQAPFAVQKAEKTGTQPKVLVTDAKQNTWEVKWGPEAKSEPFVVRLLWATGYFVDVSDHVTSLDGLKPPSGPTRADRPQPSIPSSARFEWRNPRVVFEKDSAWAWAANPFVGSNEFAGLKIMTMLVSNWDTKDAESGSPNTAILRVTGNDESQELHYIVSDWGGSMGRWGPAHNKWDCSGFREQTPDFVKGLNRDGTVRFGYSGYEKAMGEGITSDHVRWLMDFLGRITDDQIRDGLKASGADAYEVDCFTSSIRSRIEQLRTVSVGGKLSK
jgi:hypothetical protein